MHWARLAFFAANFAMFAVGLACLLGALALVSRPSLYAELESWSVRTAARPSARPWLWALGLAVPVGAALLKLAMFANFQLTHDSAAIVQYAWNFIHGYGPVGTLSPPSQLAFHFSSTALLVSPLLLLWNSSGTYALVYGAAIGATIPGVYRLAQRRGGVPLVSFLLALLAFCHPLFQGLIGTVIEDTCFAPALFVWGAYFWETGNKPAAALAALLLLTTKEQAPFIFAGLGLYLMARRADRRWKTGLLLVVGAALCWQAEMTFIGSMRGPGWTATPSTWGLFPGLGDSREAVLARVLRRPWLVAFNLVWPAQKLVTAAKLFGDCGGFPLLAGAPAFVFLAAWFPNQLASAQTPFHQLGGNYAGFVLGPLFWAAVAGFFFLYDRVPRAYRRFLAVDVLFVAGLGIIGSAGYYRPNLLPASWAESVPRAAALIPPDAKLWADGYLLPHVGLRRYVKKLPTSLPDAFFESDPFVPDRVLLSTYWMGLAEPDTVRRVFAELSRDGFETVFQEKDLVLMARRAPAPVPPPPAPSARTRR